MVRLILVMCLFFSSLSISISKAMTIVFDNVGSKRVNICLSEVKASVTSELGKKIVEFTPAARTSDESQISVDSSTSQTYSMTIDTSNAFFSGKKLFEIKDITGSLLGSIKVNSKGEFFLGDHSADSVVAGLFKNKTGIYQLIIANPENLEKFTSKRSKLLTRISGMPQQWVQCR